MRKQVSELLNSKHFDDGQKIGSEKTLRRWRSACNGLTRFRKLAGLDEHLKLQEQFRVLCVVLKAVLHFTQNLGLHSNENVTSRECIVTAAGTEARRCHEPFDDVWSTINGHEALLLIINCRIPRMWKQTAACLWPQVQIINCRIYIQVHDPSTIAEDAEANNSLSLAPAAGLHMRKGFNSRTIVFYFKILPTN